MCSELPDHLEHASAMLAGNMATLHELENPLCPGIHAFPCDDNADADHWHIGHVIPHSSADCRMRHADYSRGVLQ